MISKIASLFSFATAAKAAQLLDITEMKETNQTVAPIALLHGVDSGCGSVGGWVDMIKNATNDETVVKCVEIGDGRTTSKFMRMQW